MTVKKVKEEFEKSEGNLPELVFLNYCYSGKLSEELKKISGIKAIVKIKENKKIKELAAQIFSREFYYQILKNSSVENAFNLAKNKVQE